MSNREDGTPLEGVVKIDRQAEVPGVDFAIIPDSRLRRWEQDASGWGIEVALVVQQATHQIRELQAYARSVASLQSERDELRKEIDRAIRELEDIAMIRAPFDQDLGAFDAASKRLGGLAERSIKSAIDRAHAAFGWAQTFIEAHRARQALNPDGTGGGR